ncbi:hypothetical protein [Phaeobacter gallaeciensis]|uniref:Uncharacterized protein n=1 Tax=Phaeobacter gallaeciensis TaxID=60890 RepID=A0AAD0ECR4_9RHOB|nr:hypothetical protein [Phaeobacter gallaeciensis]AHD09486.1 hypothetical protein Gal_01730 [Phaeobacter gallaeciensis DSM 26640]ATE92749.1 hypothetical protein PhaeoP11_01721 [Phaeobacter gallaeciensis]ATE97429.1 hypothetical protein PhaeoP73_02125 [Phaeobacter gallaeciensis]ATF01414.1 hypothetical protein PhaeoP75_01771 [Phaeobacter gallaeciensis]ATF05794.1 hypothetical protein PhaeoP63_01719 [Phaeobacter gallaeciensis]
MSLLSSPSRHFREIVALTMLVFCLGQPALAGSGNADREALCRSRAEAYAGAPSSKASNHLRLGNDRVGITFSGTARIGISVQDGKVRSAGSRRGSEAEDRDDYFNTPEARRKRLVKQHYRDCMSQR